jgi:hypothetical protein
MQTMQPRDRRSARTTPSPASPEHVASIAKVSLIDQLGDASPSVIKAVEELLAWAEHDGDPYE